MFYAYMLMHVVFVREVLGRPITGKHLYRNVKIYPYMMETSYFFQRLHRVGGNANKKTSSCGHSKRFINHWNLLKSIDSWFIHFLQIYLYKVFHIGPWTDLLIQTVKRNYHDSFIYILYIQEYFLLCQCNVLRSKK